MEAPLILNDLTPDPREEWSRLLRFVGWGDEERRAALRSVEPLMGAGRALVAAVYDHLARNPDTAAILNWQDGADPAHLEERRRFLTVWLARTLGLDTSDELALLLFRAGLVHAGLGPRRVHVPPGYVTSAIGLVLSSFARVLADEGLPADELAAALGAWSRYLNAQLAIMLSGYRAAAELHDGPLAVRCAAYGRLRTLLGGREITVGVRPGSRVGDVLRKVFNAYPAVRAEVLDRIWDERNGSGLSGEAVVPLYAPRSGWRVLLNGRDVRYGGGLPLPVAAGDEVALFPPGR